MTSVVEQNVNSNIFSIDERAAVTPSGLVGSWLQGSSSGQLSFLHSSTIAQSISQCPWSVVSILANSTFPLESGAVSVSHCCGDSWEFLQMGKSHSTSIALSTLGRAR